MRTAKGHVYLIDFGIARHFKPGQPRDTTPLGSPGYAAPEQYGKAQTTPRTDLYSLGALLHHLLTGEDPADALFQFAPLPQVVGTELQMQKLDTLIRRMVHTDSEQRPISASEVKEELQSIAHLAADPASRIWYPPQGQTPSPSMAQDTFTLASARQQQLQAQRQKPKGTSRRKFITRSLVGGAVAIIGTGIAGAVLVNLAGSFSWHQEAHSVPAVPNSTRQPIHSAIIWSPDGKQFASVSLVGSFTDVYSIDANGSLTYITKLQNQYFTAPISAQAWSPDGSRMATGTTNGGIDIWFVKSSFGPVDFFPLKYPDYNEAIDTLIWSPDSKLLAISGPEKLYNICDAQSGKIIFQQQLTSASSTGLFAWSPDSKHIVIESDMPDLRPTRPALQVQDIQTGKQLFTFATPLGMNMVKASWSPDGKTIATLSNTGKLYLWHAADGSYITTHFDTGDTYLDLLWSPDSQSIALEIGNSNVQVWHIRSNLVINYPLRPSFTRAWLWLHDGRIALIDDTKTVQYLNTSIR